MQIDQKQINSVLSDYCISLLFSSLNLKAFLTCTPFNFVYERLKAFFVKAHSKLQNKMPTYFTAPHNYLERDSRHVCKQNTNYSEKFAGLFSASVKCS